eukprot:CAMPEP_0113299652 /NCGR_PEP_ID=MMETSP0010_2-20120614/1600_1 /TAXON_ID=216773 ORGANISM="Corethron hystrix, Strain 308" /NCGR_SAMPLE_ID=MMETSP0010_2 /ASSEMBLY_ACC=CAM_ASM_000155 /LENGTH=636 /DNA_ID=CAMNT_0000152927 /DNA_START=15 /DNA_END=1925 /DNA_ORIENTATION=+ /assembly_acc=CAM_ASM_000155
MKITFVNVYFSHPWLAILKQARGTKKNNVSANSLPSLNSTYEIDHAHFSNNGLLSGVDPNGQYPVVRISNIAVDSSETLETLERRILIYRAHLFSGSEANIDDCTYRGFDTCTDSQFCEDFVLRLKAPEVAEQVLRCKPLTREYEFYRNIENTSKKFVRNEIKPTTINLKYLNDGESLSDIYEIYPSGSTSRSFKSILGIMDDSRLQTQSDRDHITLSVRTLLSPRRDFLLEKARTLKGAKANVIANGLKEYHNSYLGLSQQKFSSGTENVPYLDNRYLGQRLQHMLEPNPLNHQLQVMIQQTNKNNGLDANTKQNHSECLFTVESNKDLQYIANQIQCKEEYRQLYDKLRISQGQQNDGERGHEAFKERDSLETKQKEGNQTEGPVQAPKIIDIIDSSDDEIDVKYAGSIQAPVDKNGYCGNSKLQKTAMTPRIPSVSSLSEPEGPIQNVDIKLLLSMSKRNGKIVTDDKSQNDFLADLFDVTKIEERQMQAGDRKSVRNPNDETILKENPNNSGAMQADDKMNCQSPNNHILPDFDSNDPLRGAEINNKNQNSNLPDHAALDPNLAGPFVLSILNDDSSMWDLLYYNVDNPAKPLNNACANLPCTRKLANVTAREAALLTFVETKKLSRLNHET